MKLFIATVAATLPLLVVGSSAHGTDIAAGRWGGLKPHPRSWGARPTPRQWSLKPDPRGYGVKPDPIRWGHAKPRGIRYVRTDSVRSRAIGRLATGERR